MKIYLSVPISGVADGGRAVADNEIARIKSHFPQAEIVDPTAIAGVHYSCRCDVGDMAVAQCPQCCEAVETLDYRATMLRDLKLLKSCNTIWLAPGWEKSLGCVTEYLFFVEYAMRNSRSGPIYRSSCFHFCDLDHDEERWMIVSQFPRFEWDIKRVVNDFIEGAE